MTPIQRLKWDCEQYKKKLESKKGSNYEYWKDEIHGKMIENGSWNLYELNDKTSNPWNNIFKKYVTSSENHAKKVVEKLRSENNFARIVCGYELNKQKVKMYSVIFRKKKVV